LETRLKSAEASRDAQVAQVEVDKAVIESQRASLEGLAASVEQSRRDMERQKGLLETKDIAQATFDQAKATCDELVATHTASTYTLQSAERRLIVMKHNLEVADAGIAQAKETLSYTTITSPIDGTITRINAEVGELVMTGTMNNPGTVIMVVGDLSKMLIVAQVAEADVAKLEVGQKAIAHIDAFGDKEFAGVVHSIALSHDVTYGNAKYYKTEILLDPTEEKLYSGLTAHVDIETRKHADILKLPTQAVLGRELENLPVEIREKSEVIDKEKTFATVVYRYVDGKAVVTPVKIGESDLTHTVIESGITADDKIVVGPYKVLMSIKHDQMVEDERESAKKKPGAGAEPEEDATDDANDTL
jgi:HlyD family secretion protein